LTSENDRIPFHRSFLAKRTTIGTPIDVITQIKRRITIFVIKISRRKKPIDTNIPILRDEYSEQRKNAVYATAANGNA
jgi:hypothetical protein